MIYTYIYHIWYNFTELYNMFISISNINDLCKMCENCRLSKHLLNIHILSSYSFRSISQLITVHYAALIDLAVAKLVKYVYQCIGREL